MKIIVDEEGKIILENLFDVTLKAGGILNFEFVKKAMDSVTDYIEEQPKKESKAK